jgi:hypothetical protein
MSGISNGRAPEGGDRPDPGLADSAGLAWEGRNFDAHDVAYTDDDGSADADLIAAIERLRDGASQADVIDALRSARLLIPLVAHAGELGETPDGRLVDKTQELAIVTLAGPDGRRVMPAFTSALTMAQWDTNARPVPADARRVAMAAAKEDTQLVILDPAASSEFLVRRPAVWAIGQGLPWTPSYEDVVVARAFADSTAGEARIVRVELVSGDPLGLFSGPELTVRLVLVPGLDEHAVREIVGRLQALWAADRVIAERVDSLSVALVPA